MTARPCAIGDGRNRRRLNGWAPRRRDERGPNDSCVARMRAASDRNTSMVGEQSACVPFAGGSR